MIPNQPPHLSIEITAPEIRDQLEELAEQKDAILIGTFGDRVVTLTAKSLQSMSNDERIQAKYIAKLFGSKKESITVKEAANVRKKAFIQQLDGKTNQNFTQNSGSSGIVPESTQTQQYPTPAPRNAQNIPSQSTDSSPSTAQRKPPIPTPRSSSQSSDEGVYVNTTLATDANSKGEGEGEEGIYMDMTGAVSGATSVPDVSSQSSDEVVYVNTTLATDANSESKGIYVDMTGTSSKVTAAPDVSSQSSDKNIYMNIPPSIAAAHTSKPSISDDQKEELEMLILQYEVKKEALMIRASNFALYGIQLGLLDDAFRKEMHSLMGLPIKSPLAPRYQYVLSTNGDGSIADTIRLSRPAHEILNVPDNISSKKKVRQAQTTQIKNIKISGELANQAKQEINQAAILLLMQCVNDNQTRLVEQLTYTKIALSR